MKRKGGGSRESAPRVEAKAERFTHADARRLAREYIRSHDDEGHTLMEKLQDAHRKASALAFSNRKFEFFRSSNPYTKEMRRLEKLMDAVKGLEQGHVPKASREVLLDMLRHVDQAARFCNPDEPPPAYPTLLLESEQQGGGVPDESFDDALFGRSPEEQDALEERVEEAAQAAIDAGEIFRNDRSPEHSRVHIERLNALSLAVRRYLVLRNEARGIVESEEAVKSQIRNFVYTFATDRDSSRKFRGEQILPAAKSFSRGLLALALLGLGGYGAMRVAEGAQSEEKGPAAASRALPRSREAPIESGAAPEIREEEPLPVTLEELESPEYWERRLRENEIADRRPADEPHVGGVEEEQAP